MSIPGRRPKIIVVGGGPSGGACALTLARTGRFDVLMLDKSTYPRVKVCGSGLSPHAIKMLDRLGLRERFAPHHGDIHTVLVRGPEGGELRLDAGITAWVVPRTELDHGIVQEAVQHGAEFREGTKVLGLLRDADGVTAGVTTEAGELEADFVVCADGSPSRFSADGRPKSTIRTLVGWWRGTPWNGHEAHMIWDRRLAGYYAWMFPEPGGVVNILTGKPAELQNWMAEHMGVNATIYCENNSEVKQLFRQKSAQNLKRVFFYGDTNWEKPESQSPYLIMDTQEIKTTWHPVENIAGAGGAY